MGARAAIELESFEALFGGASGNGIEDNILFSDNSRKKAEYPVMDIDVDKIDEFTNHPFNVINDEEMQMLADNISRYGVMHPVIVRKTANDRYQMISGHRRLFASLLIGKKTIPARIMELTDEDAAILMADANFLQRTVIKPSEKAKAYRMKYDAIKSQGKSGSGNSLDQMGEVANESAKTVQRFIRLSYLSDKLLELVDAGILGIVQGVDISYLNEEMQEHVYKGIISTNITMNKEQASKIKTCGNSGELTFEMVLEILRDIKKKETVFTIKANKLNHYFGNEYTNDEIEKIIFELLEQWKQGR